MSITYSNISNENTACYTLHLYNNSFLNSKTVSYQIFFNLFLTGLWINPKYPQLGASPDGLVDDPSCGAGVLEIKCPFVLKDKIISRDSLESLTTGQRRRFCCAMNENGQLVLKRTHKYFYQVQMQMGITERTFCDFVIWTSKGLHVQRIHFDQQFWINIANDLVNFHRHYLTPEYFLMRVPRKLMPVCFNNY